MPTRGRLPPFLVVFVLAFAFVGLVGFQIVKEWRIASANLSEKEFQLDSVREDLKVCPLLHLCQLKLGCLRSLWSLVHRGHPYHKNPSVDRASFPSITETVKRIRNQ